MYNKLIGLVLPSIPSYSETFFKNKIIELQKNGYKVIIYVNHSDVVANYFNCEVIRVPKLNGNQLYVVFNLFLQLVKALFINQNKNYRLYQLNKKDKISFQQNLKQILLNQFLLSEKLDWLHFGFETMVLGRENVAIAIGANGGEF